MSNKTNLIQDIANDYAEMITAVYAHNGLDAEMYQTKILSTLDDYTDYFAENSLSDAEHVLGNHIRYWIVAQVSRFNVPTDYSDNVRSGYDEYIRYHQMMFCKTCLNLIDVDAERIEKLIILFLSYEIADNGWTAIIPSIYNAGLQLRKLFLNAVATDRIETELERIDNGGAVFVEGMPKND